MVSRGRPARLAVLVVIASTLSAVNSAPAGDSDAKAHFEKNVRPILVEHCFRCHGPDKQKGGLRLDSRAAFLKGGEGGPAVVPGKPDTSPLVHSVREGEMPPTGKLADAQIATLAKWVQDGAYWPEETTKPSQVPGHAARTPGQITAADRAWWAFQPVKKVDPPTTQFPTRNEVDRFLFARLEKEGLTPSKEADRRTLIRRVTFDLTGLPPTPKEIADFEADQSSNAFEKVVDRLLESPRYGERAARFWLDLVRYAESDGYRADYYRPNAWRYRDYVVRSFREDKPYDRFVKEQLAGDEMFPDDPDALVATGFLRLGQYEYNQRDVRGQWAAIVNDITDVTGDAFLAMGVGCARCHDHKFDPILQRDYFSLQSFFGGIHFTEEPVFRSDAEREAYAKKRAAWDAKTADLRAKIDAFLEPIRKNAGLKAKTKFPADIEAIFDKPAAERTTLEQQLYELAYRQVELEFDRAETKVPAKKKDEFKKLHDELTALEKDKPLEPLALTVRDLGPVSAVTVIPGGRKKPVPVEPAFFTVLGDTPVSVTPLSNSTGRRSALANWIASPRNPLTARVIVNRLWQQHFGRGIVSTPSDFGTLGEKPTHPELLDWLANDFVSHGWKLKRMHRIIVMSAAYRQASVGGNPVAKAKDPENKFLARMTVRRLDAEQVRDGLLAVSGELKLSEVGPAVPASQPVRSVYTKQARNSPDALLTSFDAADGITTCPTRNITVTPTQSLLMLNGKPTLDRAKAFAGRIMPSNPSTPEIGVEQAFWLAYGRAPTKTETAEAIDFLRKTVAASKKSPDARKAAWTDFAHALLNSNEFLYVD